MPNVMWIFNMAQEPPKIPEPILIVIEQKVEVEPPVEEKIYTIEEKIRDNHYNCNEQTQYIRADNAECLDKPVYTPRTTQTRSEPIRNSSQRTYSPGNTYSRGYCTWYVKNTLGWVPNGWGNANTWASRARSQGYTVSSTPVVGAVAQTSSGGLGHVAVVTGVSGNSVTITEMNYTGWNRVSSRTAPASSFQYIY